MRTKIFDKKKIAVIAMSSVMALTSVVTPSTAYASTVNSETTISVVQDENGQELILEKDISNGIHSSVIKNNDGEIVSSFMLDTNQGIAYLDGELLSETQVSELLAFVENLDINSNSTFIKNLENTEKLSKAISTQSVTTWHYSGTNEGSLWLAQTSAVAAAGIISSLVPGLGWTVALNVAGALIGQSDTPYYRMNIYYGYTPGYIHVRRDVVFFKNSSKNTILYGPVTAYQKKSSNY